MALKKILRRFCSPLRLMALLTAALVWVFTGSVSIAVFMIIINQAIRNQKF